MLGLRIFLNHSTSGGTSLRRWNSAADKRRVLTVTFAGVLAEFIGAS